jgi:hypothetical protein
MKTLPRFGQLALLSFILTTCALAAEAASNFPLLTAETRLNVSGEFSGGGLTLSGNMAVVAGHVFVRGTTGWIEQSANIGDSGARTMFLEGNRLVVNGYYDTSILVHGSFGWSRQAILPFGEGVGFNGNTVAIGRVNDGSVVDTGVIHVYVSNGNTWTEQAQLQPSDATNELGMGVSVALSGDTIAAGVQTYNYYAWGRVPAVYLFQRSGTHWVQTARLTDPAQVAVPDTQFGDFLTLSGNWLFVGDPMLKTLSIFARNGATWAFTQKIAIALNHSYAGSPVAVTGDTFVVADSAGLAHIYSRTGTKHSVISNAV